MRPDVQSPQLQSGTLDEADALQARTLFDHPLVEFVLRSEVARRESFPALMRVVLAYGSQGGHVYAGARSTLGHAVWRPPGRSPLAAGSVEPVTTPNLRQQVGGDGFSRFANVLEQTAFGKHGFNVAEEHRIQLRGLLLWMLIRNPKRPGTGRGHHISSAVGPAHRVRW